MKKRFLIIPAVIVIVIAAGAFFVIPKGKDIKKNLVFATVVKGDITNSVSCSGTIKTKGTVELTSQVSGTVAKVYADYNDIVKKNQILATLDTTLLEIAVSQAEAELIKAQSQYEHDLKNYENNKSLHILQNYQLSQT